MDGKKLSSRVAIVTGAGKGIGAGIATTIAENGAFVIVNDVKEDLAMSTVAEIKSNGGEAMVLIGDVSNTNDVTKMRQLVEKQFGKLDILVNSVGVEGNRIEIEKMSDSDWEDVLHYNLTGTFKMSRAFVPLMQQQKFGRVINVPAKASIRSSAAYTAAKASILGFTRHLAAEEGENQITVNAVLPGTTELDDLNEEDMVKGSLLGRDAFPTNHGDAVVYLASEVAEHITGSVIPVDGGANVFGGPAMIAR